MSYNYSVLFPNGSECWFNKVSVIKSLQDNTYILEAFVWKETKQGDYFWYKYQKGESQEEGKEILRAFLNLDEIKLEDLI